MHCGLFCKFLGTRFVASTKHLMVCSNVPTTQGFVLSTTCTMLPLGEAIVKITRTNNSNGKTSLLCTKKIQAVPITYLKHGSDRVCQELLSTVWMASNAWKMMTRYSFGSNANVGITSLNQIDEISLSYCISLFLGSGNLRHSELLQKTFIGNISVRFYETYIYVFNEHSQRGERISLPPDVFGKRNERGYYVYSSYKTNLGSVDYFLVTSCRTAYLLQ